MNQSARALCAAVGAVAAVSGAQLAQATVTPGTLYGDSYIVTDGAKTYAVMDVYIKCSSSADIISSTFGVTAYTSSYTLNNGKSFVQSANQSAASSWLPVNNDGSAWDSFVTCGCRMQGSDTTLAGGKAGFLGLQLDTNWASSSTGGQIVGQAGGAGWYPSIGASTSTNPYAKAGQYSGTGAVNTAKCTSNISGNGITVGQSLTNYWMIGRFTIDVTDDSATNNAMSLKFCIAGRTFSGATSNAGRFNYTLTYASLPPCASDLDNNRVVDTADISVLLLDFGPCNGCPADL
ncbi:MAG: hypothetical protein EBU85_07950, partial [Actinobacteria bacterium]|nr:hypothetical protein [Actinomycetota bacterium]